MGPLRMGFTRRLRHAEVERLQSTVVEQAVGLAVLRGIEEYTNLRVQGTKWVGLLVCPTWLCW